MRQYDLATPDTIAHIFASQYRVQCRLRLRPQLADVNRDVMMAEALQIRLRPERADLFYFAFSLLQSVGWYGRREKKRYIDWGERATRRCLEADHFDAEASSW